MPEIKIKIENKIAQTIDPNAFIVCGNSDYIAIFDFDKEWEVETLKTAVFSYNGFTVNLPFEGDKCYFPILRNTTLCKVGVFAGDLRTTTPAYVACKKAITDEVGQVPPEIEEGLYEKIIDLYDDFGSSLGVSVDSDYVLTVELINKDGEILSRKSVDLPIEKLFISAKYDSVSKAIVFTLESGDTLSVPVGDLIDGFVKQEDFDRLSATVETNSTNIVNLELTKASKTYVDEAISNIDIPEVDTSNLVTLDGEQTINGKKQFVDVEIKKGTIGGANIATTDDIVVVEILRLL